MRRIVPFLLVFLFAAGNARADFNDGVVALMMGNYDQALQTFVPLAESSDHAFAQYFLGRMYAAGQGVERDAETAAGWYRKAAEKGVADAQVRLGEFYENGEGVPPDLEYAYGWYSVAAHLGNPKGNEGQERTTARLSESERIEAEKLAREFIKIYGSVPKTTARQQ